MTIPAFGRCTGVQMAILELAGYDLGEPEPTFIRHEQMRLAVMRESLRNLVEWTGQDYGFDLSLWREFLIAYGEEHGYTHPYAFGSVDEAILRAANDPDFGRWAKLAEAAGDDPLP